MVSLAGPNCKFLFTKIPLSFIIHSVIKEKSGDITMEERSFCRILGDLRREKGISQRKAAAELHISQALLSHYENGAREPGLTFVCRACDYYGVTADYILGRGDDAQTVPAGLALRTLADELRTLADRAENIIK